MLGTYRRTFGAISRPIAVVSCVSALLSPAVTKAEGSSPKKKRSDSASPSNSGLSPGQARTPDPAWPSPASVETKCKDGVDNDKDGKLDCDDWDCQSPGGDCVPAPKLDRTVASTMLERASILYTGDNPLQKSANPGSGAVIFGTVVDAANAPMAGVRVYIQGRPQLGYTYTRANGRFDMAVGSTPGLVVVFDIDDYVHVTRNVAQRSGYWVEVPTVGLTERRAGRMTGLVPNAPACQAARSNAIADGERTMEVMVVFEAGSTVSVPLPNGASSSPAQLTTTVTLFPVRSDDRFVSVTTTGNSGFALGSRPHGGTIGFDIDVAEARAFGSDRADVSKPLSIYFPDRYGQPVRLKSPLPKKGVVRPSDTQELPSGIIRIVGAVGDMAEIDIDGNGKPESAATLESIGIGTCDRQQLLTTYPTGTRLNFMKSDHF